MKLILLFILLSAPVRTDAQQIKDFKIKNEQNASERTYMLDLVREKLYSEFSLEVKFVVDHFKVSSNYAWFEGNAQLKNGKPIEFDPDWTMDCCRVFNLFQKKNGIWIIAESQAFCTDMCQWGIGSRFPQAPKGIFPNNEGYFLD